MCKSCSQTFCKIPWQILNGYNWHCTDLHGCLKTNLICVSLPSKNYNIKGRLEIKEITQYINIDTVTFRMSKSARCSYVNFTVTFLFSWLETNTPYYYLECVKVVGPQMEQGREKLKTAAIYISENATHFILWVKEKTPQAVEWVRVQSGSHKWHTMLMQFDTSHPSHPPPCPFLCPDVRQYPRRCVPGAGIPEGAVPLPPSQLCHSSTGTHIRSAAESVAQSTGLLQVSTLWHPPAQ